MNVTLPNGYVLTDVPDYTPKEEIMSKAIAAGYATADDFNKVRAKKEDPSFMQKVGDVFTGNLRETPEMTGEGMINDKRILGTPRQQAEFEAKTFTMFDPNELAKVAVDINPDLEIRYNKDGKGNVYPILTNSKTGQSSMINMPGIGAEDVLKGAGTGLLFARTGGKGGAVSTMLQGAGKASGVQTAIETKDALVGGDFNPLDIAAAGLGGVLGEAIPLAGKALASKVKGFFPSKEIAQLTPEMKIQSQVSNAKAGYNVTGEITPEIAKQQVSVALKNNDKEALAAMVKADPEYLKAMQDLGMQNAGLASASSTNVRFQEMEQALKKIPASDLSGIEKAHIAELQQKADDLITKFAGTTDQSSVSIDAFNKSQNVIKNLGEQADEAYSKVSANIPKNTPAGLQNTINHIYSELDSLGWNNSMLSPLEQKIYKLVDDGGTITFGVVDRLRKDVGATLGRTSDMYKTENQATLKKLYSLLSDDQESVVSKFPEMAGQWKVAKELVKSRKELEENSIKMFGAKLNDAIVPKVGNATVNLSKGDYKKFFEIVGAIPKRDRQQVIISALNDAFTMGSRKEKQLSVAGFADWYNGMNKNPRIKSIYYRYLPPEVSKTLESLGKVSNGIRNSQAVAPVGGQVMAAPGVMTKVIDGIGEKVLSKIPGMLGGAVKAGLRESKTSEIEAASKVLADPSFRAGLQALAEGQTKKALALEKTLMQKQQFKEFVKSLTDAEKEQVLRMGFMSWLAEPQQEAQQ